MHRPLSVMVITQPAARDRLLNSLIDHSDPSRVKYSVVLLSGETGPLHSDMAFRSVAVRSLGLSRISLEPVPVAVTRLRRVLRRSKPDVVHSLLFYACLATELARGSISAAPPSLLARHHELRLHHSGKRLHVCMDRWMAMHATHVVAASEAVRKVITEREGVPLDHVDVIRYGLDWKREVNPNPEGVADWKNRFAGKRLVLAVGRLDPQKDYSTLLNAFARVADNHRDCHLAIAGLGDSSTEVQEMITRLRLSGRVTLLGWVSEIYDLMAAAEVFVQSSIDEALPQTIIEAAGLGVPVVATAVGGVPEILGEGAYSLPARDAEAFASRVGSVLDNSTEHRSRAQALGETVRANFDARRMAEQYTRAYEELAMQTPAARRLFSRRRSRPRRSGTESSVRTPPQSG